MKKKRSGGWLLEIDINEMKDYIAKAGIKQKIIAQKSGMDENQICRTLQGGRKLLAEEYINICHVLQVPITEFIRNKPLDSL